MCLFIISVNYVFENILKQKWNIGIIILQNNKNDMFQHVPTTNFERDYVNDLSTAEDIMMTDYVNKTDTWERYHVTYPHTSPSIIYPRNNFFMSHMFRTLGLFSDDLYPIFCELAKKNILSMFVTADHRPDCKPMR